MQLSVLPAIARGQRYAFPVVWLAVLAAGVGFAEPLPSFDIAPYMTFAANAAPSKLTSLGPLDAEPEALVFVRHEPADPDDGFDRPIRQSMGSHGRFAAPGNAVRRHVLLRSVNPRTADELAGFFHDVAYTLADIRLGEAVPPIRLERVPADLSSKDGNERKALFIIALLPVVLEVNHRVLADREQLLYLRDKIQRQPVSMSAIERIWLEDLAQRYDTRADDIDELVRRVDIVPPSMAIAQGGVESGWGTSIAARNGNALFGMVQAGTPLSYGNVAEATRAYVANLNTHPAYAAFRSARAALRERNEPLSGYKLIGSLLRYSEMGQAYVKFVRDIMRENDLADFDNAKLSGF